MGSGTRLVGIVNILIIIKHVGAFFGEMIITIYGIILIITGFSRTPGGSVVEHFAKDGGDGTVIIHFIIITFRNIFENSLWERFFLISTNHHHRQSQ